jgi:DNA (cytosine-5)-methyltransferase 1
MLTPQYLLPIHNELVVDLFAGGGGASTGIELAIGRAVDVAINHDAEAISLHTANHPQTQHFCSDVFEVDPVTVTQGQPVGLLWASPDCKHFSKAKGGKPVSKKIRSLAWVVVKWAKAVRPRMIFLENVEEFQTWGPLTTDNLPDPLRKGDTFRQWKGSLEKLGYVVEHRELRACDYGAPTIRKRLFLVARRDGLPIVWPEPTHAAPASLAVKAKKLKPWRTAAECIDWSIPAPSIFERKKPLAEATCRRIAKGIIRYVLQSPNPFIVSTLIQAGQSPRVPGLDKPIGTLVGSQKHALVSAFLAKHYTGVVGSDMAAPVATVTSVDHHSLVTATMVTIDNQSSVSGQSPVTEPLKTTVTENRHALVTSNLVKMRGDNVGSATDEPLHTISAQGTHHAEVRAFLIKYYGTDQDPALRDPLHTVTTKDRFGLVTIKGEDYQIVDIGLRMLTPRELYRAQGFPQGYQIDFGAAGEPLTKTAQVRMCGNSVCPPLSQAIVRANYAELAQKRMVA